MDFLELVKKRRSIRQFDRKDVEQEKLDYIMECARLAPSAVNYQPWLFFIVKSETQKRKLQQSYSKQWFEQAPLYIVACADKSKSWKRTFDSKDHVDIDLAIAVEHICLAATEQGLGACWVCNFDPTICSETLNLPEYTYPVAIIPIGYYSTQIGTQIRKSMEEIVQTI